MIERKACILNQHGIHCRPSSLIIRSVQDYTGHISVKGDLGSTDLRSILELMALELFPGAEVVIRVEGPDEEQVCASLVALFETHFDFPDAHNVAQP